MAILRAGVGARALAKSLEVSGFLNLFDVAAPSLFLATALTPSASESSPVLVVAALWLYPLVPPWSSKSIFMTTL